eukprot:4737430-Pyramimonas_sp.AAC.1
MVNTIISGARVMTAVASATTGTSAASVQRAFGPSWDLGPPLWPSVEVRCGFGGGQRPEACGAFRIGPLPRRFPLLWARRRVG